MIFDVNAIQKKLTAGAELETVDGDDSAVFTREIGSEAVAHKVLKTIVYAQQKQHKKANYHAG